MPGSKKKIRRKFFLVKPFIILWSKKMNVCLLGASFETANLGVSALADSAISGILSANPDAKVFLLDYAYNRKDYRYEHKGEFITIPLVNIRFSKKFYMSNNIAFLIACVLLNRFTCGRFSRLLIRNMVLKKLLTTDVFVSITAGDSFSDIYGKRSFLYVGLPILLASLFKKKMIFMPQTYGPFKACISECWARVLLKRADHIYSRDFKSIPVIKRVVPLKANDIEFCHDVAFGLPAAIPHDLPITVKRKKSTVVGVNVSGLLYMGGYKKDNMFGLKMDYRELIEEIVNEMLAEDVYIQLIPHVVGSDSIENDTRACKAVYDSMSTSTKDQLCAVEHNYDQREIKGVISLCDFFIGSRMHACIAALSQGIPAVGIAYSRKFIGLYETIDCRDLVLDPRQMNINEIITSLIKLYKEKDEISNRLSEQRIVVSGKLHEMFKSVMDLKPASRMITEAAD